MKKRMTPVERLAEARLLYLAAEHGLTDQQVAEHFGIAHTTAWRIRIKLRCNEVVAGHYTLEPSQADVALAKAILARAKRQP